MFRINPVVCATKPSFEVREYPVDVRQPVGRFLTASLDSGIMSVVVFFQRLVALQTISLDGGSMFDDGFDKTSQSFSRKIGDHLQTHATGSFASIFHGTYDNRFAFCSPAALAGPRSSYICLIDLDDIPQPWIVI